MEDKSSKGVGSQPIFNANSAKVVEDKENIKLFCLHRSTCTYVRMYVVQGLPPAMGAAQADSELK